ncbi:hypothetical protein O181_009471 [Austropuccinia psidii MF-1]|uniref:Uncharacterized protein n=1 Tax=Austropuccinia psidii MF-1 TaxID=1389203 RepID=A0A9Q3BPD3_9BASI|nr:hypothetical protein [Austropuccinia psidii MF-1]
MLTCPPPLQMRLRHCPPISSLTTPYASAPRPHLLLGLKSLRSCGALKSCVLHCPHPPLRLLAPAAYHPYACGVPFRHSSNAAYHPYACGVPSLHSSDTTYHPYACIVPAQHASNTAYHPYARSALPTCLQCCLPSLRWQCPPDMPPISPSYWHNCQGRL